ncbi:MAG: CPBP family intramembrane glutamic endopeptidase [Thermomicrobiales bacterium]
MAETFSGLMLVVVATVAAYLADLLSTRASTGRWPRLLVRILAVILVLVGLGALVVRIAGAGQAGILSVGVLAAGLVLLAATSPSSRTLIARILPLDPDSTRDWVGLVVILWLVILRLVTFSGEADEEFGEISLTAAAIQTAMFIGVAIGAIGLFVRRGWREALERLGLDRLTVRAVGIGAGSVIPVAMMGALTVVLVEYLAPGSTERLDRTVTEITGGDTSLLYGLVLGISAAAGEETLFRGAIQPKYGLIFTSLVFAVLHAQYDLLLIVASLFPVGLIFGLERKYLGTYACIVTHALYNTLAVVLG